MWSCVGHVEEIINKLGENTPSFEMCGWSHGERLEWSQQESVPRVWIFCDNSYFQGKFD